MKTAPGDFEDINKAAAVHKIERKLRMGGRRDGGGERRVKVGMRREAGECRWLQQM
jgi:hypothetical protein